MKAPKIFKLLLQLWGCISPRRKFQFSIMFCLMICAAFAEIISIGSLIPFLTILTTAKDIQVNPTFSLINAYLGSYTTPKLLFILTLLFCIAAVLAGAMRIAVLWISTRLAFMVGAELSYSVYLKALHQPYIEHLNQHSSELIEVVTGKGKTLIYNVILPVVNLIGSFILLIIILGALVFMNPLVAFSGIFGFGSIYFILILISKSRLQQNSYLVARNSSRVIKALQEGVGGIRDVIIDKTQLIYAEIYNALNVPLRRVESNNIFITQSPRYFVESLGIVLIAVIAYLLTLNSAGINSAIPILGAMALGAQRLVPVLQMTYGSWSSLLASGNTLEDTLFFLHKKIPDGLQDSNLNNITFMSKLELENIFFRYKDTASWVLQGANLSIEKGARIGFVGKSGAGKTTFIDIIMGLLSPDSGQVRVDGTCLGHHNVDCWQALIAHVPQTIFLTDASFTENIAFGVPKDQVDHDRVMDSAEKAQLAELINSLPGKYDANVGERGVRLSGGQRQRVGLARALYKKAEIIIFDEATSARDDETERAIMKSIDMIDRQTTIIIVAHRLSTLRLCTSIYELKDAICYCLGTYEEMILKDKKNKNYD